MSDTPEKIKKLIKVLQKGEITEYYIYMHIAKRTKNEKNRKILEKIALQEKAHYEIWTKYLGQPIKPSKWKLIKYKIMNAIFGYTFTLKLMENGEDKAKQYYDEIGKYVDKAHAIALEEDEHEQELIQMLDEERLNYVGSMVLGLNDALVELTGTLAGLTFALGDTKLISLSGLVTGIAASLSMAASEYLSEKADNNKNALKSAFYTGIAYIMTVAILILPYLLIPNPFISLVIMLGSVVFIIFFFNYYISVAKDLPFKKRFLQMAIISLGVAAISFGIGILVKMLLGIDI
ncbi:MAG: VIT1/CCC1 transporter family protein [Bacilli bacterium]|nr:VIT1/CCC1 transporter family protein [Bacilli bacterium]